MPTSIGLFRVRIIRLSTVTTTQGVVQNLRRIGGAPGSPALRAGQIFQNEAENVIYAGFGDDGQGNATAERKVGGSGAFADLASAQTIGGAKTFSVSPQVPTPALTDSTQSPATTAYARLTNDVAARFAYEEGRLEFRRRQAFAASPISIPSMGSGVQPS